MSARAARATDKATRWSTWIAAGAVSAVVVGGLAAAHKLRHDSTSDGSRTDANGSANQGTFAHALWPRGAVVRYAFAWTGQRSVAAPRVLGADRLDARFAIDGALNVRVVDEAGGGEALDVTVEPSSTPSLRLRGQEVFADPATARATYADQHAYIRLDSRGRVVSVQVRADAPLLFRRTIPQVVESLGLTVPGVGETTWNAEESGPSGLASVDYARDEHGAFTRTRARYSTLRDLPSADASRATMTLRSASTLTFTTDGGLATLDDHESFDVATVTGEAIAAQTDVSLRWQSTTAESVASVDLAGLAEVRAGTAGAATTPRERDVAALHGMDADALSLILARLSLDGALPKDANWISRAAAMLRLNPELVDVVSARATDPKATIRVREVALDLLVATGDARAQAALRTALGAILPASSARDGARLVQRLGMLAHPDAATLAFTRDTWIDARHRGAIDLARGGAAALGASAGALERSGDHAAALGYANELVAEAVRATDAGDRGALALALGNTRVAEVEPELRALARDATPGVRADAAFALRFSVDPSSHAQLVAMLADPLPAVAAASLRALTELTLTDAELGAIADAVVAAITPRPLDGAFVDFFAAHLASRASAERALRALELRAADKRVWARIDMLLGAQLPPT